MGPLIYARVALVLALAAGAWFIVDLIGDKRELVNAVNAHTRTIGTLLHRQQRLEQAMAANQDFDDEVTRRAGAGVAHNETTRRTDHAVMAIDQPWPAAMRHRVFADPDPASGSTAPAGAAGARDGDRDQVPQPR